MVIVGETCAATKTAAQEARRTAAEGRRTMAALS
jgi:hypothetical protein